MVPLLAKGLLAALLIVAAAVIGRRLWRQEDKLKSTVRDLGGDDANLMTVTRDHAVDANKHDLGGRFIRYCVGVIVCGLLFGSGVILLFTLFV